ncbi:MAG: glutaminyl-peptide cyclotransferase [Pleurocapsa minor GSE-CHR-MK-17-07R]|jgi:glutaminyl-peptide cyclotransferase|nr:glutaminyl-peptide cyclotransferase [Pleurocapsa minor GSE-CHR-MK 17-07R]
MSRIRRALLAAALLSALPAAAQDATPEVTPEVTEQAAFAPIPFLTPSVLAEYPHNTQDFTQGLVMDADGRLFQSTGLYGSSELQELDLETGEELRSVALDEAYFAEGLALVDDRLIQITWQENTAFVYDVETFELLETFEYEGQGWGLCYDGASLWMTDGSANLFRRDPDTFELLDTIPVDLFGSPVTNLNELECANGVVLANVWQTDYIMLIQPESGDVVGVIDASSLIPPEERIGLGSGAVLNGIVYLPETETYLVTGKLWPTIFEVALVVEGNLVPR